MIRYALSCRDCDHGFEAWFSSSSAFDALVERGLVSCPDCGGSHVGKQIMAPTVKRSDGAKTPDPRDVFGKVAAKARQHIADNFDYVGTGFASEARAMYYGETGSRPIWGETTPDERKSLKDEGVPASPLPDVFVPPKPVDKDKAN